MDSNTIINELIYKIISADWENLAFTVGIPVAILILQLYLRAKDKRTTSITFIENKTLNLSPTLIKDLQGLSIKYDEAPINGNVIFYQFTITNSGSADIQKSAVYEPLCLKLPDNYIWKSVTLFSVSENLKMDVKIDNSELIVSWDLFKKGEYARLNAVVDYQGNDQKECENLMIIGSMMSKITFAKSRIADLIVSKTSIRKYDIFLRSAKTFIFLFFTFYSISCFINRFETELVCQINPIEDVDIVKIKIEDEVVLIRDVKTNKRMDSFFTFTVENIEVVKTKKTKEDILDTKFIFVLVNLWGLILLEQHRMRRKRVRLGLISDKPWNQFEIEDC